MQTGGLRTKGITKQSQENMPLITIVTVVFNGGKTLEETILSVINQTYQNVEYIIVDGASTDGTLEIVKKYEDRIDYWISEPDEGIYYAMNKGIDLATGEWINFMNNGDKYLVNNILKHVISKMLIKEAVYYGDVYMLDKRKVFAGKFSSVKLSVKNICHQAIFYPKSVYTRYKYLTKYRTLADYYYNIFLFKKVKFVFLNETIALYEGGGACSIIHDYQFRKDQFKVIAINLGIIPLFCRIIHFIYRNFYKVISRVFNIQ